VKQALDKKKVHRAISDWIISMLKHCIIMVKTEAFTLIVSAVNGLPQGGGLSHILWSVVADSLLTRLSKQGVFAQGYADNGVVLVCSKFLPSFPGRRCTCLEQSAKSCHFRSSLPVPA